MNFAFGPCRKRSKDLPLLDDPSAEDEDINALLSFLNHSNRWLGLNRLVNDQLESWAPHFSQGQQITFLDLYCGRGDLSKLILLWARRRKLDVQILAVDPYARSISIAKDRLKNFPQVSFDVRDMSSPHFLQAQQFDFVVSRQCFHRLPETQISLFLKRTNLLAKRGFLVVDWLRGLRSYWIMKGLSHYWGDSFMRKQVLLTVAESLSKKEIRMNLNEAGLEMAQVQSFPLGQVLVSFERGLLLSPNYGFLRGVVGT